MPGGWLQMVCVNPDRVTVSPMGELTYVPGQLAARYVELGGRVQWYGKPYPGAFRPHRDERDTLSWGLPQTNPDGHWLLPQTGSTSPLPS